MRCSASECAKMLALNFAVLVSMSVVLAAPGISRKCYHYCKTKDSEPYNKVVQLECNCANLLDTEIASGELSSVTLDDTGVYFVPAEVHFIQDQFHSQPFYISNPAKLIPKTRNRINREFESSKGLANDPLPSQSSHIEIYKKTETISHTTIDEKSDRLPLYLDLEIMDSTNMDRAALQKYTIIEDIDKTEHALVKCLDFQVVHYTRIYGQMKEFQDFWEARNLNKYEHWSDLDLEKNIQAWCNEPASIVQQSLHEIKQGLPKKGPESRSANPDKDNINETNNTNKTDATITTKFTEPEITTYPFDPSYDSTEKWAPISTTPSSTSTKEIINEIQNFSFSANALSDSTTITTESTTVADDPNKTKSTVYGSIGITTIEPEILKLDLDTMASQDVSHTYVPASTGVKIPGDLHILNSNTSFVPTPTTPLSTEQPMRTESAITISDVDIFGDQSLNENNTLLFDTPQSPVIDGYSGRSAYQEKEMKIPKIITKECHNTVQTIIDGIEELPNNDFRNNESAITGKLYFVSNKELVPVRFVQTNSGAISLGMDGPELCNKLISKADKKSHFLTTLCEYISNMYQNVNP